MTDTAVLPTSDPAAPETPFRWRLAHRPDVRFGHAAGGVAGILLAASMVAFVIGVTDDDATLPGVGFNLLLIVAALAAGFFVRGPVRSAAVAALVFAIPQVWLFAIIGDGEGVDRGDFRIILLLSVASYVLFYALTWTRGRAILLGVALLLFTNWIIFEVADQAQPFGVSTAGQIGRGFDGPQDLLGGDQLTETGITELVIAVVLLGGAIVLDRRGRAGAATPLLFVGGLNAVTAAATFGADVDDVYAVGVFLALAGLTIGLAGSLGKRRGTSWVGAAVLLVGAVVVVGKGTGDAASGDHGSAAVFGAFALIAAAVLLVIGVLVARAAAEPIDGGEPAVLKPPTPDPAPEPALVAAPTESSAEAAPTDTTPAESTPTESTPTESTPTESTPTESTPTESTPTESTPTESTPTESSPAESSPAETPPAPVEPEAWAGPDSAPPPEPPATTDSSAEAAG